MAGGRPQRHGFIRTGSRRQRTGRQDAVPRRALALGQRGRLPRALRAHRAQPLGVGSPPSGVHAEELLRARGPAAGSLAAGGRGSAGIPTGWTELSRVDLRHREERGLRDPAPADDSARLRQRDFTLGISGEMARHRDEHPFTAREGRIRSTLPRSRRDAGSGRSYAAHPLRA